MARIQLTDTVRDIAVKMCDGNPGALNVIMACITQGKAIDPDAAFGGIAPVLSMDTLGLYGPHIWMLYKDVCGGSLVNTIAVLRAWQLGFVSDWELHHAIENRGRGIDVDALVSKVKDKLPRFGQEAPSAEQERQEAREG